MWNWKIVFLYVSRNETIDIVGKGYPSKRIAEWEMGMWVRKFLPCFFSYKLIEHEVKEIQDEQAGDN